MMVSEMSRETVTFVMESMPYARGLQFVTLWCQKHKVPVGRPSAQVSLRTMQ